MGLTISLNDERQDSDYDGAWKDFLHAYLREVVEKYFPVLAAQIDWTVPVEWLDKEISQIVGQLGHRNRTVDILFKVRLINGLDQWILCHLEIQTNYETDFEERVDFYNAGLKWQFRKQVISLVILADINPNWRPNKHRFALAGFVSHLRFPTCKLLDRLKTDWANDHSFPVDVARAQLAALQTASDPEGRYHVKTQFVRNLYNMGYTADEIRERFRMYDWFLHLRSDLSRQFKTELIAFEQEQHMPYVTSVERIAQQEGGLAILLRQLTLLCGQLPEDVKEAVEQLSLEQSQALGDELLHFRSLADLRAWLTAAGNTE